MACVCMVGWEVLTADNLPLPAVKQNLLSEFSVQLIPKEDQLGRNPSRGPAVQHWVSWLEQVGFSGSNPSFCESIHQSFAERLLLTLSIAF